MTLYEAWFPVKPFKTNGYSKANFYFCLDNIQKDGFTDFRATDSYYGFETKTSVIGILDLNKDIKEIYNNFRRDTKRSIKKFESPEINVNENYGAFINMLNEFSIKRKLNIPKLSLDDVRQHNHTLINAYINKELIVSHFFLREKDFATLLFSCSKDSYASADISRCAHWHAIKLFKGNGIKIMSFGSTSYHNEKEKRITDFKMGFGLDEKNILYFSKTYSNMLKIIKKIRDK